MLHPILLTRANLVNELSNNIDLNSTLIRAEALFRRFERTVEAIDRKNHFPAPSVRPLEPSSADEPGSSASNGSMSQRENDESLQRTGSANPEKEKVVSPELRQLLTRKPPKMDKNEVWKDLEVVNRTAG